MSQIFEKSVFFVVFAYIAVLQKIGISATIGVENLMIKWNIGWSLKKKKTKGR